MSSRNADFYLLGLLALLIAAACWALLTFGVGR